MERTAVDARLTAALNPAILERQREGASALNNTLLQDRRGEDAEEAGTAAAGARPLPARPLAARPLAESLLARTTPADTGVARRVVARWRAFVAERKGLMLLRLLALPDLFQQEVLKRLDPMDRTMVAQVGRPWPAAVLASGFPRLPKYERAVDRKRVRLRLRDF